MNLQMEAKIAHNYKSESQKIRVITENWVSKNLFCPYCGNEYISQFENNRPVADFYCSSCIEEYELKSKSTSIGNKVNDGAYDTMINRIESVYNPNFFFMHYDKSNLKVKNLIVVPKYFFRAEMIEKRNPLTMTAKRAGWVGCNIILNQIPTDGRIFIIKNEIQQSVASVVAKVKRTEFINQYKLDARGWILDILDCINKVDNKDFTLEQIYQFEDQLSAKHPENKHVKEKIRQQLQVLRDKGFIEFNGRGHYSKLN